MRTQAYINSCLLTTFVFHESYSNKNVTSDKLIEFDCMSVIKPRQSNSLQLSDNDRNAEIDIKNIYALWR